MDFQGFRIFVGLLRGHSSCVAEDQYVHDALLAIGSTRIRRNDQPLRIQSETSLDLRSASGFATVLHETFATDPVLGLRYLSRILTHCFKQQELKKIHEAWK